MDTPEQQSRALALAFAEALKDAGISQRDAAAGAGIPLVTLSRRLTGKAPLRADEMATLAALAGTSVSAIAARAEQNICASTDSPSAGAA